METIENKVALITGAGQGIGKSHSPKVGKRWGRNCYFRFE